MSQIHFARRTSQYFFVLNFKWKRDAQLDPRLSFTHFQTHDGGCFLCQVSPVHFGSLLSTPGSWALGCISHKAGSSRHSLSGVELHVLPGFSIIQYYIEFWQIFYLCVYFIYWSLCWSLLFYVDECFYIFIFYNLFLEQWDGLDPSSESRFYLHYLHLNINKCILCGRRKFFSLKTILCKMNTTVSFERKYSALSN